MTWPDLLTATLYDYRHRSFSLHARRQYDHNYRFQLINQFNYNQSDYYERLSGPLAV